MLHKRYYGIVSVKSKEKMGRWPFDYAQGRQDDNSGVCSGYCGFLWRVLVVWVMMFDYEED